MTEYRMCQLTAWVDRHPYVAFAIFLAFMFGAMALIGMDDCGDRVRALGGH